MFGSQVFHENARFVWMLSEPMKICIQFLSFLSLKDGFPHPTLPRASEESVDREKKKCAFHGSCQRCSKSLKRSIKQREKRTDHQMGNADLRHFEFANPCTYPFQQPAHVLSWNSYNFHCWNSSFLRRGRKSVKDPSTALVGTPKMNRYNLSLTWKKQGAASSLTPSCLLGWKLKFRLPSQNKRWRSLFPFPLAPQEDEQQGQSYWVLEEFRRMESDKKIQAKED